MSVGFVHLDNVSYYTMYTGRQGPSEAIEAGVPLEPVPGLPAALPPPPAFLHPFPPQVCMNNYKYIQIMLATSPKSLFVCLFI